MEELQIRSLRSHILLLLLSLLLWTLPSISALGVNQRSLINDRTMPLEVDLSLSYTASGGIVGALFLFGDSLCDTGNGPFVNHGRATSLPFGMTFPGYAIGRFSDGRDIIPDFLAVHLGLPPLNPWLNVFLDFDHGANYAIPGATALASLTPFALAKQISWHLDLVGEVYNRSLPSDAAEPRKRLPTVQALHDALYVIQIGGLDYRTYYLDLHYPPELVGDTIVPLVVEEIRVGLETLYYEGHARNFVVAGVGPQGCLSSSLATFINLTKDSRGCIESIDDIIWKSRQQTLAMLNDLHELHLDANYTFVDYHSATHYILDHADQFGFTYPLDACCGAGPTYPYGFQSQGLLCSNETEALYVCPNPVNFINWDGIHYTDSFNFQMFNHTFLTGFFMYPIDGLCRTSASQK